MKIEKTPIKDLLIIKPDIHRDERGYFYEYFKKSDYVNAGISADFVQDNVSKSMKNTLRGLHYQAGEYAQGKLCSVIYGRVFDVAVDIRFGSPTFGEYYGLELSSENDPVQFWIPPGFAHGFSVLSDFAIFFYKCTAVYNRESERTIIYNDKNIDIDWKIDDPVLSKKDLSGLKLSDIKKDFHF